MLAKQNTSRTRLKHYPYVIIGAGTTALNAMEAIFEEDPQAQVLMLTSEHTLPRFDVYTKKGALAPDLMASYKEWRQHVTSRLEDEPASFVTHTFNLQLGMKSLKLDSERRTLIMDDDKEVTFDRCLIATEGKPRQFYVLDSEKSSYFLRDRINTLSNLFDFEALSEVQQSLGVRHVTVVGGGFLGTEIALACAKRGMAVAQVYAETAPLCRHLPIYLALEVQSRLKAHGVMPIAERLVTDVRSGDPDEEEDRDKIHVTMMGWKTDNFSTEYLVLASTHIDPVVDVGKESGLEIDAANGGILVNGQLEAVCGIYAAGACASYHDKALGRRRVDMFDHSVASGKLVGKNMALRNTRGASYRYKRRRTRRGAGTDREGKIGHLYNYQPVFESHLAKLDVHIQGVGEVDSTLRTVGVWVEGDKGGEGSHVPPGNPKLTRGIVYYLKGSTIVGMMLWNAGDLVDKVSNRILLGPQSALLHSGDG
ncbi:unnamed protein product [Chrysoparadoxa australica]